MRYEHIFKHRLFLSNFLTELQCYKQIYLNLEQTPDVLKVYERRVAYLLTCLWVEF